MPVPSSIDTSSHGITRCSTSTISSNGPRYRQPTSSEPGFRSSSVSSGYRLTATHSPLARLPYSSFGLTAAATLAGSGPGVVVQITTGSLGRARGGDRAERDGTGRGADEPGNP